MDTQAQFQAAQSATFQAMSDTERRAQQERGVAQRTEVVGHAITCTVSGEDKKYAARWTLNGRRVAYDTVRAALIVAFTEHATALAALDAARNMTKEQAEEGKGAAIKTIWADHTFLRPAGIAATEAAVDVVLQVASAVRLGWPAPATIEPRRHFTPPKVKAPKVNKTQAKRDERTAQVLFAFRGHRHEFEMLRGVLLMSKNWSASDNIEHTDKWVDGVAIAARMDELNAEAIASVKTERAALERAGN